MGISDTTHDWFLHGERIRLRQWSPNDEALAISLWGNPAVTRLIADLGDPSPRQALERLAKEMRHQTSFGLAYWPAFTLVGEFIGCCGLRPHQPELGIIEIGIHLLPTHWGKGFATEALGLVGRYAFASLAAQGLFARHHPQNHVSGNTLRKLGFQPTHLEFMPQTGLDHPCYLVTPTEFAEPPRCLTA